MPMAAPKDLEWRLSADGTDIRFSGTGLLHF